MKRPALRLWIFTLCLIGAPAVHAGSVEWQALPFPSDSDWPGPTGEPAVIGPTEIVLRAQPARTVKVFHGPVTIDFDVKVDAKVDSEGEIWLSFIPPGVAADRTATNAVFFQLGYNVTGFRYDLISFFRRTGIPQNPPDTVLFVKPFPITADALYHVTLQVAANRVLSLTVDGQSYALPETCVLPFDEFQIQIQGWLPAVTWRVRNFNVSEQCANLVGTWSGTLNIATSQQEYRKRRFTVQITDQNADGCLLHGTVFTGTGTRGLPFTGTIMDSKIILNFGRRGQASAVLDLTGETPMLKNFLLLAADGAGHTGVGDLSKEP